MDNDRPYLSSKNFILVHFFWESGRTFSRGVEELDNI